MKILIMVAIEVLSFGPEIQAMEEGNTPNSSVLIEEFVTPNDVKGRSEQFLHWAAGLNDKDLVTTVLNSDSPVDIDAQNSKGRTPLMITSSGEIVQMLIDKGAGLEVRDQLGWTALHYAVSEEDINKATLLLNAEADLEALENEGCTPLNLAVAYKKDTILSWLLDRGVDTETTDTIGWTPLHFAAFDRNLNIATLLLNKEANIKAKGPDNLTPFIIAASAENNKHYLPDPTEIVTLFLERGADISAVNEEGKTAYDLASPEIKKIIQSYVATQDSNNNNNNEIKDTE